MSFISIIVFSGVIQGFFLAFTLWIHNKGNRTANRLLALLIFLFSIYLLIPELVRQYPESFPHLIASTFPLIYLLGPISLLYVSAIYEKELQINRKWLLHFIPAIMCLLFLMPFYVNSAEYKLTFFNEIRLKGAGASWSVLWGISCVHFSFYTYLCAKKIKKFDERLKEYYSNIDEINLSWLWLFFVTISILWALYFILFLLSLVDIVVDPYGIADYFFALSLAVVIFAIGFMVFRKPEVFSDIREFKSANNNGGSSYLKSGLNDLEADKHAERLSNLLEDKKLYLNSDLNLEELARELELPPKYLSEILNKKMGITFYELINIYRGKEAGKILEERSSENIKMIEVMFDSGFNSKSTFNKYFKKVFGTTPSQYRNKFK